MKFTEPGKWYFVVDCLACEKPLSTASQTVADPTANNTKDRVQVLKAGPIAKEQGARKNL